ncbi:phosphoribosyltransferase family protein [Dactylosporangium sp. NPDC051484]|uniref:phosphoribosyltransferase family protein n=1 Tax=Dactylosporangium sp. NPDC051484 TaxID=3154942 RepID=UPI00344E0E21
MNDTGHPAPWAGRWVTDRLGVTIRTTTSPVGLTIADLVGLALRRNPRRAHLLVSTILGKHVPADPRLVLGAGLLLGALVGDLLRGTSTLPAGLGAQLRTALTPQDPGRAAAAAALPAAVPVGAESAVVVGYAETATGLGHAVADALGDAVCLHSTRRAVPGMVPLGGFTEEHSHATEHLLLPADPAVVLNDLPLVLVDDELSTGTTALNTIAMLHRLRPRRRYVIAALVDTRSPADQLRMARAAAALDTEIEVVALVSGSLAFAGTHVPIDLMPASVPRHGTLERIEVDWPAGLPGTGRHGFTPADRARLDVIVTDIAARIPVDAGPLLVLGTEELMYTPLRIAAALADRLGDVRFSTTTRSPAVVVDDPGYPLRSRLVFAAHDNPPGGGERYAYNVEAATVLVVVDPAGDTPALHRPDGLLTALTNVADRVLVATVGEER